MSDTTGHMSGEHPEEELARLADGSLPESQRERVAAAAAASPRLSEALGEQRRAVELLGELRSVRAPEALRERLDAAGASPPVRRRRRRRTLRPALAGLIALLVVLAVTAGRGGPTIAQTVNVALARASAPAPAVDPADPGRLSLAVGGISFPAWGSGRGWWATGTRTQEVAGREVTAVYYSGAAGERVGYAIVSGRAIPTPAGRVSSWGGVSYTLLQGRGVQVVTWRSHGHTCVLAARGVGAGTLLALAQAA